MYKRGPRSDISKRIFNIFFIDWTCSKSPINTRSSTYTIRKRVRQALKYTQWSASSRCRPCSVKDPCNALLRTRDDFFKPYKVLWSWRTTSSLGPLEMPAGSSIYMYCSSPRRSCSRNLVFISIWWISKYFDTARTSRRRVVWNLTTGEKVST